MQKQKRLVKYMRIPSFRYLFYFIILHVNVENCPFPRLFLFQTYPLRLERSLLNFLQPLDKRHFALHLYESYSKEQDC